MKLSEDQIAEILEAAKPDVLKGVTADLVSVVTDRVKYDGGDVVGKFVREWVAENVIPEVESALVESKEGLVAVGTTLAASIVQELSTSLCAQVSKNLETPYKRTEIMKALFT